MNCGSAGGERLSTGADLCPSGEIGPLSVGSGIILGVPAVDTGDAMA